MYYGQPVKIPEVKGKITYKKYGDTRYVLFETGRRYDPNRKYTLVDRVSIGRQIPGRAELMLPNENYPQYFPKKEEGRGDGMDAAAEYAEEREHRMMLRDLFEQMYFEFQIISRRNPNQAISRNKAERINRVLKMLKEMMKEEKYATFLELITEPEEKAGEGGENEEKGMTHSDVSLLMTQYKGAVNRFFQKRM